MGSPFLLCGFLPNDKQFYPQSYDDLTCHYLSPLESSYGIDRFGFHLDISETFRRVYERDPEASTKLVRLTMIFGVRYIAEGCGEWWDNNWGMVGLRACWSVLQGLSKLTVTL